MTVRNEGAHIGPLLESLLAQQPPFEIVITDAGSTDGTVETLQRYAMQTPQLRWFPAAGSRGAGRNAAARMAHGEALAFIDGDCVADPQWLAQLRGGLEQAEVVAGQTHYSGFSGFVGLGRVSVEHKGVDITYPSCNLAYRTELFRRLGGFDTWFMTAEDVDLNFRAVETGATLRFVPQAMVHARAREHTFAFCKQAFWNGYGRKQLTLKHGRLWGSYQPQRMFANRVTVWSLLRLLCGMGGYAAGKMSLRRAGLGGPAHSRIVQRAGKKAGE